MRTRDITSIGAAAILAAGGAALIWSSRSTPVVQAPQTVNVRIGGALFRLEIAASESALARGLSGRSGIEKGQGMIFVFAEPEPQTFVMRDCFFPIDLMYLDQKGKVLAMHTMMPEPARSPVEHADTAGGDEAYTARLKGYASLTPAQFAIELREGTLKELGVRPGDLIPLENDLLEKVETSSAK